MLSLRFFPVTRIIRGITVVRSVHDRTIHIRSHPMQDGALLVNGGDFLDSVVTSTSHFLAQASSA